MKNCTKLLVFHKLAAKRNTMFDQQHVVAQRHHWDNWLRWVILRIILATTTRMQRV